jgi:hypothetical protein
VAALSLDVLIYPELGIDHQTLSFARQRLAATQAVFLGHPVSQGLQHMDYFISSVLFDVHNPKCQFPRLHQEKCPSRFTSSEQLLLLDELPVILSPASVHASAADDAEDGSGADDEAGSESNPFSALFDSLALPAGTIDMMDKHVYLLPHAIRSYSTLFIRAIASILLRDPIGFVVILYSPAERLWYEKLRRSIHYHIKKLDCHTNKVERATAILQHFPEMQTHITQKDCVATPSRGICKLCCECSEVTHVHTVARRLVLLPRPPTSSSRGSSYGQYIYHSSVVLDSFPAGMDAAAAADIFRLGRPVITLPNFQTSPSAVLGLVRRLRLNATVFVADNLSSYVQSAVQVTQRSAERDVLVELLERRTAELFTAEHREAVVAEWSALLKNIGRRS